ncbi:MAG TPA: cation:proton antiporter, partial [Polyangiaceae bacterium]|nr:cation:proton antiporter [Polyangiaceae bacterium]
MSVASHQLYFVLLALAVVVVVARAVGALFVRIGQPPVVGEVVAGIVLGPSLLGRVAPGVSGYLFPREITPFLGVIAQIGVVLFMFLVGLELDGQSLRKRQRASLVISQTSIVVPFVLGALLGLFLYPRLAPPGVPFPVFALFVGVSMSVTAFPVLARILTDLRIQKT